MTKLLAVFFTWVAVYLTVTAILSGFQWAGSEMPLPVQTFLVTAVLVPAIVFIIGPLSAWLAEKLLRKLG